MSVRLDRFQLSVVDSPQNASLCVAACPGSGKSTTLACRARKLLADGVPPAQLIVLTFSTKSRDALARRLAERGVPVPDRRLARHRQLNDMTKGVLWRDGPSV